MAILIFKFGRDESLIMVLFHFMKMLVQVGFGCFSEEC